MRYRKEWQDRVRIDLATGIVRVDGREVGVVAKRMVPGQRDHRNHPLHVYEVDGIFRFETMDAAVHHIFSYLHKG